MDSEWQLRDELSERSALPIIDVDRHLPERREGTGAAVVGSGVQHACRRDWDEAAGVAGGGGRGGDRRARGDAAAGGGELDHGHRRDEGRDEESPEAR